MKTVFTLIALALAQAEAREGNCHALVMSGGANNGAWEAGVLWGLVNYGNPADFTWDVVTGVSAGALNTGFVVMYPPGQEIEMTQYLSDTWNNITSSDIWLERPGGKMGMVASLISEPSILNDAPLLTTVQAILEPFRATGI